MIKISEHRDSPREARVEVQGFKAPAAAPAPTFPLCSTCGVD